MLHLAPPLLAQANNGVDETTLVLAILVLFFVPMIAVGVIAVIGMWTTFEKAGRSGWTCLIPIYSHIVMLQIAGRPAWWLLLMMIPGVGIIFFVLSMIDLARAFEQDVMFGLGLAFLGFIFFPILGLGNAKYIGPQIEETIF